VFTLIWTAFDVVFFPLLFLKGEGPRSALLPVYLLLIAETVQRLRVTQVWFGTVLCLFSYVGLLADASWRRPHLLHEQASGFIFVLSLGFIGLIQHFLLSRAKTA
jgi:hypothetical protein